MGKEGSVAPKERVNITYKPATGDQQEEVELPLRFMMMGDYTGKPDDTPLEERKPINIDKDNFNEVMAEHNLSLDLTVDDKLSGEDGGRPQVQRPEGLHAGGDRRAGARAPAAHAAPQRPDGPQGTARKHPEVPEEDPGAPRGRRRPRAPDEGARDGRRRGRRRIGFHQLG